MKFYIVKSPSKLGFLYTCYYFPIVMKKTVDKFLFQIFRINIKMKNGIGVWDYKFYT